MQLKILLLAKALAQVPYVVLIQFQTYKEHFSKSFKYVVNFKQHGIYFLFYHITFCQHLNVNLLPLRLNFFF